MKLTSSLVAMLAAAGLLSACATGAGPSSASAPPASPAESGAGGGWDQAREILGRIRAPAFPDRTFAITDFGARAGGEDCTAAIAKAIAACHASGGGHVSVPAGTFRTGAIRLLSNVDLHLEKGSVLQFSTDPKAYLPAVFTRWESTECMNYSPFIYAYEQENIAVTGPGTLDGQAGPSNWWSWTDRDRSGTSPASRDAAQLVAMADRDVPVEQRVFGAGHYLRPNFFQPNRCRNVLIEGITIVNSPMWELNPVLCTNVIARGVTIDSPKGPNNDGFDPESCRDVLVEGCSFATGDDCIAIKSGRNRDGRRVGVAMENMIVRDCVMKDGHAGVAIGSEVSGSCRNIFIEKCRMDSPNLQRALRVKSNASRGGTVEGVHMRDIQVGRVAEAILTVDFLYEEGAKGDFPPVLRDVTIERVTCKSSPRVLWVESFPAATVDGITFSHCTFNGVETADVVKSVGRISFDHVDIIPAVETPSLSSRKAVW
ncbi:MAG TPA: glycoside hydrolase family 28 protein [Opitutaceae bacterium]|nr:glycoside hydrolase family 28 protein [Opitutaceae bacterium]